MKRPRRPPEWLSTRDRGAQGGGALRLSCHGVTVSASGLITANGGRGGDANRPYQQHADRCVGMIRSDRSDAANEDDPASSVYEGSVCPVDAWECVWPKAVKSFPCAFGYLVGQMGARLMGVQMGGRLSYETNRAAWKWSHRPRLGASARRSMARPAPTVTWSTVRALPGAVPRPSCFTKHIAFLWRRCVGAPGLTARFGGCFRSAQGRGPQRVRWALSARGAARATSGSAASAGSVATTVATARSFRPRGPAPARTAPGPGPARFYKTPCTTLGTCAPLSPWRTLPPWQPSHLAPD